MIRTIFIIAASFFLLHCHAQTDTTRIVQVGDSATVKVNKKAVYGSARKATLMSAILPGLGQAYNRKYWKIPIIYAGMGGCGYLFYINNSQYQEVRKYLRAEYDEDSLTINTSDYTGDGLAAEKARLKKNRDFSALGVFIFYILNVIDANVDAHLKTFDVSDDLSMHIGPWQTVTRTAYGSKIVPGLSIKLNFK